MAETRFVANGFAAGVVGGLVSLPLVLKQAADPRVGEVLSHLGLSGEQLGLVQRILGDPVILLLVVVPTSVVVLGLLGLLFGWVHEELYKRTRGTANVALTAIVSGLLLTSVLTLPNLFLPSTQAKLLSNLVAGLSYTVALTLLSRVNPPTTGREGRPPRF